MPQLSDDKYAGYLDEVLAKFRRYIEETLIKLHALNLTVDLEISFAELTLSGKEKKGGISDKITKKWDTLKEKTLVPDGQSASNRHSEKVPRPTMEAAFEFLYYYADSKLDAGLKLEKFKFEKFDATAEATAIQGCLLKPLRGTSIDKLIGRNKKERDVEVYNSGNILLLLELVPLLNKNVGPKTEKETKEQREERDKLCEEIKKLYGEIKKYQDKYEYLEKKWDAYYEKIRQECERDSNNTQRKALSNAGKEFVPVRIYVKKLRNWTRGADVFIHKYIGEELEEKLKKSCERFEFKVDVQEENESKEPYDIVIDGTENSVADGDFHFKFHPHTNESQIIEAPKDPKRYAGTSALISESVLFEVLYLTRFILVVRYFELQQWEKANYHINCLNEQFNKNSRKELNDLISSLKIELGFWSALIQYEMSANSKGLQDVLDAFNQVQTLSEETKFYSPYYYKAVGNAALLYQVNGDSKAACIILKKACDLLKEQSDDTQLKEACLYLRLLHIQNLNYNGQSVEAKALYENVFSETIAIDNETLAWHFYTTHYDCGRFFEVAELDENRINVKGVRQEAIKEIEQRYSKIRERSNHRPNKKKNDRTR